MQKKLELETLKGFGRGLPCHYLLLTPGSQMPATSISYLDLQDTQNDGVGPKQRHMGHYFRYLGGPGRGLGGDDNFGLKAMIWVLIKVQVHQNKSFKTCQDRP